MVPPTNSRESFGRSTRCWSGTRSSASGRRRVSLLGKRESSEEGSEAPPLPRASPVMRFGGFELGKTTPDVRLTNTAPSRRWSCDPTTEHFGWFATASAAAARKKRLVTRKYGTRAGARGGVPSPRRWRLGTNELAHTQGCAGLVPMRVPGDERSVVSEIVDFGARAAARRTGKSRDVRGAHRVRVRPFGCEKTSRTMHDPGVRRKEKKKAGLLLLTPC